MKRSLFLIFPMLFASVVIFGQGGAAPDLSNSPCNEYYEAAIKFIVDTPVVHPFSTSATTKVTIAPGNLQYQASTDTWRFALNQYDICGNGAGQVVATTGAITYSGAMTANVLWDSLKADGTHQAVLSNNALASRSYGGWIDMFAWGTSGHGAKAKDSLACNFMPYTISNAAVNATYNAYGYGPSYATVQRATLNPSESNDIDVSSKLNRYFDWGYYNNIREYSKCSHTDGSASEHKRDSTMYFAGVWRTPSGAEWDSILHGQCRLGIDNQSNPPIAFARIKYGAADRDTMMGLLIFPDDYRAAEVGVSRLAFAMFGASGQPTYSLDAATWEAMDAAGVVFLPCAGTRNGVSFSNVGTNGYCWAASGSSASNANYLRFDGNYTTMGTSRRYDGRCVRLVQDHN